MTPRSFALIAGAALAAGLAGDAQAGPKCAPRDAVVTQLATRYGESRQSIGLGANNAMIEVFASTETGTWTILATRPSGVACIVAAGQAFETLAEALPGKGNDA